MPAGTKAGKAEAALKRQAEKKGLKGKRAGSYVYGGMNKAGLMRGNKVTRAGMSSMASNPKPKRTVAGY